MWASLASTGQAQLLTWGQSGPQVGQAKDVHCHFLKLRDPENCQNYPIVET